MNQQLIDLSQSLLAEAKGTIKSIVNDLMEVPFAERHLLPSDLQEIMPTPAEELCKALVNLGIRARVYPSPWLHCSVFGKTLHSLDMRISDSRQWVVLCYSKGMQENNVMIPINSSLAEVACRILLFLKEKDRG